MQKNIYVAVVQKEGGHDECVASLVSALNNIGLSCVVFMAEVLKSNRGDVFCFSGIDVEFITHQNLMLEIPKETKKNFVVLLKGNKDKIVFDSLELLGSMISKQVFFTSFNKLDYELVKKLSSKNWIVNAFVHGPKNKSNLSVLMNFPNTCAIIFSRRMDDFLAKDVPIERRKIFYLGCMNSHEFEDGFCLERDDHRSLKLVIPGKVDKKMRDYSKLIQIAQNIAKNKSLDDHFEIIIAGGIGRDGLEFRKEVERLNLEKFIKFPLWPTLNEMQDLEFAKNFETADYLDLKKCLIESDLSINISYAATDDTLRVSGTVNLCIEHLIPVCFFNNFDIYEEFDWPQELNIDNISNIANHIVEFKNPDFLKKIKKDYFFIKNQMCEHNKKILMEIFI